MTTNLPTSKWKPTSNNRSFQETIVQLISTERRPEEALDLLSEHYRVERPRLKIGPPRGEKKALRCYAHREKPIHLSRQEHLSHPYLLIHEFYHHLSNLGGQHRGTERHAH